MGCFSKWDIGGCGCGSPTPTCAGCSLPETNLTMTLTGTQFPTDASCNPLASSAYSGSWTLVYYGSGQWYTDCLTTGPFLSYNCSNNGSWKFGLHCDPVGGLVLTGYIYCPVLNTDPTLTCPASPAYSPYNCAEGGASTNPSCTPPSGTNNCSTTSSCSSGAASYGYDAANSTCSPLNLKYNVCGGSQLCNVLGTCDLISGNNWPGYQISHITITP